MGDSQCVLAFEFWVLRQVDLLAARFRVQFRSQGFELHRTPQFGKEILPFAGANVALYAPLCDVEDAQKELEGCGNKNAAGGCNMRSHVASKRYPQT